MAVKQLNVSSTVILFGNVAVGKTKDIDITLTNSSSPTAAISGNVESPSSPFSLTAGSGAFNLAADTDTKTVTIRFAPTASGSFVDSFDITHDASTPTSPITVDITGTGVYLFEEEKETAAGTVKVLIYDAVGSYATPFTNCSLKRLDPIEVGYVDQDESVFFPSGLSLVFRDLDRTLFDRLKDNEDKVEIYLEGTLEYIGVVDLPQTEHNVKEKETTIVAFDKLNTLKNLILKDSGNYVVDQFGYASNEYRLVTELITDIFQAINPDVTIDSFDAQDWVYKATDTTTHAFTDLEYNTNWMFGSVKPFATVADLLKYLADMMVCTIGMKNYETAYIRKRFADASSATALTTVKNIRRLNDLPSKIGVRVYKNYNDGSAGSTADEGTVTTTTGGDLEEADKVQTATVYATGAGGVPYFYDDGIDHVAVNECKDTAIDSTYRSQQAMMAKFFYTYRSVNRERWEITLQGVAYSITTLYSYGGKTLRPSKVKRDLVKNETIMTAVVIA